jgi:hypothetical protein
MPGMSGAHYSPPATPTLDRIFRCGRSKMMDYRMCQQLTHSWAGGKLRSRNSTSSQIATVMSQKAANVLLSLFVFAEGPLTTTHFSSEEFRLICTQWRFTTGEFDDSTVLDQHRNVSEYVVRMVLIQARSATLWKNFRTWGRKFPTGYRVKDTGRLRRWWFNFLSAEQESLSSEATSVWLDDYLGNIHVPPSLRPQAPSGSPLGSEQDFLVHTITTICPYHGVYGLHSFLL